MLHGRDDIVSMVQRWLTGLSQGAGGALHLVGVPGVGKSAVLEDAQDRARDLSIRVVRVFGHPEESAITWGGLSQVVTPFLGLLDELETRPRSVLLRALRLGEEGEIDEVSIGMALLLTLTRSDEPVAVIVDDVHWLDPESRRILTFVARRLHATGVGLLAGGHHGATLAEPQITLEPLTATALRAIARDRGVAPAVAEILAASADGLPLVLEQMIAGLDARQRTGTRPLPEPLAELGQVDVAIAQRLDSLGPLTRRLLAALALAPSVAIGDLEAVVGSGDLDVLIAPAVENELVIWRDGEVSFAHPLIRTAAAQLPDEERRSLHLALAAATGVPQAAWHLAAAASGPDEAAAAALDLLAADAEARGAHLTALRARQRAIELSSTPDPRRLLAAARSAVGARLAHVADSLLADLDDQVETRAIAAEAAWVRGDVATARRGWSELAQDPLSASDMALRCRRRAARAAFRMYDIPGVRRMTTGDEGDDPMALLTDDMLLRLLAIGDAAISGFPEAPSELDRFANRLLDEDPDTETVATVAEVVTLALARTGRAGELLRLSERVADLASQRTPQVVPALLIARAAHRTRSDLIGGVAMAREAMALAEEWGLEEHRPFALAIAAIGEASMDGPEAPHLAARMRDYPVPVAQAVAAYADALVHYGRGDLLRARDLLLEIHDAHPSEIGFGFFWHPDLVDIALRLEDRGLARRVADDLAAVDAITHNPWVTAAIHRITGLLSTDRDHADADFAAAIEGFGAEGYAITAARCRLDWAERLRRDRRRSQARAQIELARIALVAGGATRWVQRCDVEAEALGMAVPTTGATAASVLTPRELQVARWLVAGLTFKQIGARLFLSPRTVEAHGQTVYRKLQVRGRAELAQLAQQDPTLTAAPN